MTQTTILVLGSGMVARPCVDYLLRNHHLPRMASPCRTLSAAERLASGRPNAEALALDVSSSDLDIQVASHDLVIPPVPYIYHADVVRSAIRGKTHVVTTSYVSPALCELDAAAKAAGITVLNEVGVDPGVDHLYAVKTITDAHNKGGKFSWSPRGVLLSQFNSATFLKDGEGLGALPRVQNIPEAHTVIRGSLRYEGNPALVKALIDLGWLDSEPQPWPQASGLSWTQTQQRATNAPSAKEADLLARVDELCNFSCEKERETFVAGLRWMGMFSDEALAGHQRGNLLDTLSARLNGLCRFQLGERDLVMLQHKFVVQLPDGSKNTITSTLELFGEPGDYAAMAKSMLLDGFKPFAAPGVLVPCSPEICDPLRAKIEAEGIKGADMMYWVSSSPSQMYRRCH
ncbi:hypothetical protein MAPG_04019 [Magnaporthiopsis poae ATCC 64411]|uniref:Saccharopine dehydrogenase n=1 Tax=Magnaporthiopsis poae (strain ATCC 64411 / 73-15) TaxID=644358 RepID=A0A0C4DVL2_MAGP6|nr:hypothetical protein MAPG_04019 [Magnaporthiopsis poae ATCC 64411]